MVECPCCGWKGKEFLLVGTDYKRKALCPGCDSLERHRLYYLYLSKIINKEKNLKVLHFAPEKAIKRLFESYKNINYLNVDIDSAKAMKKEDITNISFDNNSFDIIFCSHVLEHIEDDRKAMKELYRVLKKGGFAILQVPLSGENTLENPLVTNPEERERLFGQNDHVRIYGKDYKDRLEEAGFRVSVERFADSLSKECIINFDLSIESIYLCKK